MDHIAVITRFRPEQREHVKELLEAGPPFDLADEPGIEHHAVYLSSREAVFVFEGPDVAWEVEELTHDFLHPNVRAALAEWRRLLDEEPHIGRPVFVWDRAAGQAAAATSELGIRQLVTSDFVAVAPEDTLGEAVERMATGTGAPALVVDYGRLIGVLESQHVLRAVAARVHPSDGRVREWMAEEPIAATLDTSAEEAARLMIDNGVHHLPVVDGERPLGLVSLRSVVAGQLARH